jgi:hypothetical protein
MFIDELISYAKGFNGWYDELEEPMKFFVAIAVAAPGIMMIGNILGMVYLCLLVIGRAIGK